MDRSIARRALCLLVGAASIVLVCGFSLPLPLQEDALFRKVQEMQQRIDQLVASNPATKSRYEQHMKEFKETARDNRVIRDIKTDGIDKQAIDNFISSQLACQTLPGVAVVAVKDGQVVYKNTFGTKSAAGGVIDDQTLFGIGSTTKAFTSALIGMLAEKGLVQLESPVSNYIPGFRLLDPTANELVTVRDLLSHRTGLPRHDAVLFYGNMTREDLVYRARYLRPSAQIREAWQYNNWMVMTAGYLAGKVTGLEWEDLVQRDIFDRLNMTTTKPNFASAESVANKANPQYWNGHAWIDAPWDANKIVDPTAPAGAINSNLVDMAKWMNFHLQQSSPALLSARTLLALHSQQMAIPRTTTMGLDLENMLVGDAYGLAWFVGNYRGMRHVFHGGDVFGFHAEVSLLPDENFGVTILTNADNPSNYWREVISSYVADQVLGLKPLIANSTVGCRFPCSVWATDPECQTVLHGTAAPKPAQTHPSSHIPDPKAATSLGSLTPSDYTGVYANPGYGNLTVSYYNVSDTLYASYGSLVQPLVSYRDGSDMFFAGTPTPVANSNTLTFWRNTQFQVIAATLRIVSDVPYEITFTNNRYTTFDFPGQGFLTGDGIAYLPSDKAGPQGPAGATGPTGPSGPAGPAGSSSSYSPGAIAGIVLASIFAVSVASSFVAIYIHRRLFSGGASGDDSGAYVSMSDDRRA